MQRYNEMMKTHALFNEQREGLRNVKLKRDDNREKRENEGKVEKERLSIEEQRKIRDRVLRNWRTDEKWTKRKIKNE
jgi:hypothetical protein